MALEEGRGVVVKVDGGRMRRAEALLDAPAGKELWFSLYSQDRLFLLVPTATNLT